MLPSLTEYFAGHSALDLLREVVDVSIVYYLIYRVLLVLRGTRAVQIGIGLLLVFVLHAASYQLHLVTLLNILSTLIPPGAVILILVVVFQGDIRRGLMRIGSQTWLGMARARESQAIDEVVEASTELARHRIGAIIAFEQDANLDEFVGVNKGHDLDAAVSSELLVSVFVPEGVNKLHDGAVIIRNLRIAKAGVFFPMPESRVLDPSFGSRHRAALGITEETDAVVVVVSEERGTISFCFNGNIVSNLDGPGLRRALEGVFSPRRRRAKGAPKREGLPPTSQRISNEPPSLAVRPAETARSRTEVSRAVEEQDATLVSVPAEGENQTTRIRSPESESETPPPSQHPPPAPLRRKLEKPEPSEKSDGEQRPTMTGPARVQRLTTPMRGPTSTLGGRTPNPEGYSPPSDDGRGSDSNDGGVT
ncbi:MAG TPA: diadenylate cyclase CdaA [Polyangiaceae bacterium]|nr:diadenylate cyclase CdaA [Polyangiaceae bacterium]